MRHARNLNVCIPLSALTFALALPAAPPSGYRGKPFDDAAYRATQLAEAALPKQPYHSFTPALPLWESLRPTGTGWVGPEEPAATVRLDEADPQGRRTIHYHATLSNYRYAAFGWRWDKPFDLGAYDALSFAIKVSGPRKPQELFFGLEAAESTPLSLREYDPNVLDGSWHTLTVPVDALGTGLEEIRSLAFKTFVWDPADFDVQLDAFTLDRAVKPLALPAPANPKTSGQTLPGRLECAFYDLGGEGVAYHDTTPINILSAVLNQQPGHQRPHATRYEWNFRKAEGVDISFTKDWADLNHPNRFDVGANQLYIGGTEDGEWCNYTVNVKKAGIYKVFAVYGNDRNGQRFAFSLNGGAQTVFQVPVVTGGMHTWTREAVGQLSFPEAGPQVLTLHYGRGFNLAYFEFVE